LEVRPCDASRSEATPAVSLTAGEHVLRAVPGKETAIDVDRVVLASQAGGAALAVGAGRVAPTTAAPPIAANVTVEKQGRTSLRARVEGASEPFWLVLGESKNAGWKARVVGGDSLGASRLVDGYANGWRIDPAGRGAFEVELTWTPQRRVAAAIAISGLGILLCGAIVVATWLRRRGGRSQGAPGVDEPVLINPFRREIGAAPTMAVVVGALSAGVVAAVVVGPRLGLLVTGMAAIALVHPRSRGVLVLLPPVLLGAVGLYVAYRQQRDHLPPVFEWPTLFPRARTLGWLAIVLLGVDALIELVRHPLSTDAEGGP